MTVEAIRNKTVEQVRDDVDSFSARYIEDWNVWINANFDARLHLFGRILRKWQATRPLAMRRLKAEAKHGPPYLDDLLELAAPPLCALADLTVVTIANRTTEQNNALATLWTIFLRLPTSGDASCVGITKAILLLTNGKIGPALDSQVRNKLGVNRPLTCRNWIQILQDVSEDIAAFESRRGPLTKAVPTRFSQLAYGRLYDMALGPRGLSQQKR